MNDAKPAVQPVLLLVDDTPTNLQVLMRTLSGRGYRLLVAKNGETALEIAKKAHPDLILLDIMMPGIDGYETCRRLKADPETQGSAVIFMSALDDTKDKVKGFEVGAVDYVAKPFKAEEAIARVETHLTIQRLRHELEGRNSALAHELRVAQELVNEAAVRLEGALVGTSAAVTRLRANVEKCAGSGDSVLLEGPNGAGHEAVARAIHAQSDSRHRAFLNVSCLGLSDTAEKILFGNRGFLGLGGDGEPGKWDLATGGTLFLDHIDALPDVAQKALAGRVEKARKDGGARAPRLIAATSKTLDDLQATDSFRPKLAALFSGARVSVPPLVERADDIPALVDHFLKRRAGQGATTVERISRKSVKRLRDHVWAGGLDELQSVLECALASADGKELEVDAALLHSGQRAGNYRLIELLGRGGMGEVWTAEHELLRRPAAVKLIRADRDTGARGGLLVKRFEREARVTAGLRSPNTVQLYDYGVTKDGAIYYVMELLDGIDLSSLVKEGGPIPVERAIWFLEGAARSLAEAHDAGLVHRDIKPANIMTCRLGHNLDHVKVLDFGVVRSDPNQEDLDLTGVGVVGSPAFISPEAIMGKKDIDGRADLYGLGCVGYWLLTGRPVFDSQTASAAFVDHCSKPPPRLSAVAAGDVPAAFEALMAACLAKEPGNRPASAAALWKQLRAIDVPRPWSPERAEGWWENTRPKAS